MKDADEEEIPEIVELPIDGILDLHTFHPRDVKDLVHEYLEACLDKGITQVRIIHGKGKGVLRKQVHTLLERHPKVISYRTDPGAGSWGATIATLDAPKRN